MQLCELNLNDVLDTKENELLDNKLKGVETRIGDEDEVSVSHYSDIPTIDEKATKIMRHKDYPFKHNSLYYEEFNIKTENIGSKKDYYQFILQRYKLYDTIMKKKGRIKFNKMILECKHSYIIWYNGLFQVLIIVISAIMSLVESITAHYSDRNKKSSDFKIIFPMVGSFLILLISSITKYCKLDEKREMAALILLEAGTCLNKLKSHETKLFNIYKPDKDWDNLLFLFETHTAPLYADIMLKIGNMLPEEDAIFFKDKIKRDVLRMKVIDQELSIIDKNDISRKDIKVENYCWYVLRCLFCPKKHRVRYNRYIKKHRKDNETEIHWTDRLDMVSDEENPTKKEDIIEGDDMSVRSEDTTEHIELEVKGG